jgi:hypothetical protein
MKVNYGGEVWHVLNIPELISQEIISGGTFFIGTYFGSQLVNGLGIYRKSVWFILFFQI